MTTSPKRPAIFLDRDGTIIEDLHYPREAEKVRLIPKAVEGMRRLQEKGYLLFVVSNQSGVGRGIIQDHEFKAVHDRCCQLLQAAGVEIAEFSYCFHQPSDECSCRKPRIGLVAKEFQGAPLDWKASFVVGDKLCDVELGLNIGAQAFLVLSGKGAASLQEMKREGTSGPYQVCDDLLAMAERLPDLTL